MRLAVAQILSTTDPIANLAIVEEHAARARASGAEFVVFPEATMASFARRSRDVAEPPDGPWATEIATLASDIGITIAAGLFTRSDAGAPTARVRNTLLVTGAGVHAVYDKMHLFDALGFAESEHIEAGDTPVRVHVAGMTLGLALCYDVRFPELFKYHAQHGAQAVLVPASWQGGPGKVEQWRALCVARALDSTCYVIAAGQADPASAGLTVRPGSPTGVGHSVVVDPFGRVLAEAGAGPELLVVDLDPAVVDAARSRLPVLANARFTITAP